MTVFEAYITNLGKYAEGQLVGETLKFPASTVIYCTSLTRMPVEQMVSIRSARPRSPVASAAATNLSYSPRVSSCLLSRNRRRWILRNRARQSVQPQKQKKPFSAAKQALMVDGA